MGPNEFASLSVTPNQRKPKRKSHNMARIIYALVLASILCLNFDGVNGADCVANPYKCLNKGTCSMDASTKVETCDCSAATAHEGTFCHTLKSTACSVTCTATKFSGCTGTTCVCNPGITGALCETAAAVCTGANAATLCGTNGACHRISSADTCFCNPGYGGTTCSTEIKCTKTPTNCTQCRMETGVDKCKKCKDGYALPTCANVTPCTSTNHATKCNNNGTCAKKLTIAKLVSAIQGMKAPHALQKSSVQRHLPTALNAGRKLASTNAKNAKMDTRCLLVQT